MTEARVALDTYLGLAPVMQSTPNAVQAHGAQSLSFSNQTASSPSSSSASLSILASPHRPSDRDTLRTASLLSRPMARDIQPHRNPSRSEEEAFVERKSSKSAPVQAQSTSKLELNRAAALRHIRKALEIIEQADGLSLRAASQQDQSERFEAQSAPNSLEEDHNINGNIRHHHRVKEIPDQ